MLKRLVATLCGLELALVLGASAALALPSEAEDAALPGTFAGTVPLSSIEGESEGDGYALFLGAIEEALASNADTVIEAKNDAVASEALTELQQAAAREAAAPAAEPQPEPAPAPQGPSTLALGGTVVPYVGSYLTSTAPEGAAGLWYGSDSTTDGSWGYFIGHNPGVFDRLLAMGEGSPVTVVDRTGAGRTYTVVLVFDVPNSTTWEDIESSVTGHGESIILQTCIDGGANYRIMVAS